MIQRRQEDQLRAMFRELGAVTPGNARPAKEFPTVDAQRFDNLLREGVIREAAPGTFYLYDRPPVRVRQLVRQVLFWIVVIITPMGIISFCGQTP